MRRIPAAYLASYLLSLLGNSIAAIALPLIVLKTTGSALGAGMVAALSAVPAVLAGLFMGVVIDRINRRTSSIVTDLISAASLAALPIVDVVTGLNLGWFVLFGIIGALGDVPGLTAREALLPSVVRNSGITAERLVGLREALGAAALIVGPATAGILMSVLEGSTVLWITAGTSLAAALVTMLIPHHVGRIAPEDGAAGTPRTSPWAQLREGWSALLGSRLLVAITALSVVSVFVLGAFQGIILPVYFTIAGQPGLLGFVLTSMAVGLLLGAGVYAAVGTTRSRRTWLLTGLGGSALGFAVMGLLASPVGVLVGAFLVGAFSGVFNSLLAVLMVDRIPEALRGRIGGTQNAVLTAVAPAATLVAALLVEFGGLALAAAAITAVWLVAAVAAAMGKSLRSLDLAPVEVEEVTVA